MKSVLFVTGDISRGGGTERVLCNLSNGLVKRGVDVEIISFGSKCSVETSILPFPLDANVRLTRTESRFLSRSQAKKALKSNRSVVLVEVMAFQRVIFALDLIIFKILLWEHFNFESNLGVLRRWLIRRFFLVLRLPVVVLTKADRRLWSSSKFNLWCSEPFVIPNIVLPPKSYSKISRESDLSVKTLQIVMVGRLEYQKGFHLIPEIVNSLRVKEVDFHLTVFGEGSLRTKVERRLKEQGINSFVSFKGFVADDEIIYSDRDLLISPSLFEGFGMMIAEALSHRIPVIAFDCNCGPSDLIFDRLNGHLVPKGRIDEFVASIVECHRNPIHLQALKANSDKFMSNFLIEPVVDKWLEVI